MDRIYNPCIINLFGVYAVQVPFDFCTYEALDPVDKKKMFLVASIEGTNRVLHKLPTPSRLPGDVMNETKKNHCENSWVRRRKKVQSTAFSIQAEHQIDKVDSFLNIENRDKSIYHLIKTYSAHEIDYDVYLDKLEINDSSLYLSGKDNEVVSEVPINK